MLSDKRRKLHAGVFARGVMCLVAGLAFSASGAIGGTYYLSPTAAPGGDGSMNAPWGSPDQAIQSGVLAGGDRILLLDGEYGVFQTRKWQFNTPVEITAAPGNRPHLSGIQVAESRNVVFRGLSVWPVGGTDKPLHIVRALRNSSRIVFDKLDVRSREIVSDYYSWPKQKWLSSKASGFLVESSESTVSNSNVTGVYHGIMISGEGDSILNNKVRGFGGDGMRAIGDNSVVRGNDVRDCFKIDENHDDGFQTWSTGPNGKANQGTVHNLTVEGNIIQEWTGPANHPLQCVMQGIFMGGYLDDLIIRNNVISVSAYHGITGYGITRGTIENNTLVNSRASGKNYPWIGVWGYKDRGSRQVIVANNVAPYFNVNSGGNAHDPRMHNVTLAYPAQQLRNPFGGDYRPKPGSSLIDAGTAMFAPPTDIAGTIRNKGNAPDIGAYEVQ